MTKKYFTLEEANELLPTLESELVALQHLQSEFQQKLKKLNRFKQSNQALLLDTIFTLESELDFLEMEAQLFVNNIHSTGAQLKDIDLGLLDFPAMLDGEKVLLCWKQGEKEIAYYHGEHEGFVGRKPLTNKKE